MSKSQQGLEKLEVRYHLHNEELVVGTLAQHRSGLYFEYDSGFLKQNHWLSPFRLPLQSELHTFQDWRFGDIWGLFADSLPDGWGMLLMDRFFQSQGRFRESITILERLAYLGNHTMGALTYHPATGEKRVLEEVDLYQLAQESTRVLSGNAEDVLSQLLWLGGSPGGARPKVLVGIKDNHVVSGVHDVPQGYAPYLLKFHARAEDREEGLLEESYAQAARLAGLEVPHTRLLFEPTSERFYFAIRRFDRQEGTRVHIHTLGGLLHSSHRNFECDYHNVLQVARALSKKQSCVEKVFRQMLFNIVMNNRDDHVKNFSFLYDGHEWHYAPSYDLTFHNGPRGEHSMMVFKEGRNPGMKEVLHLAQQHNIDRKTLSSMCTQVLDASLAWSRIAKELGVSQKTIVHIQKILDKNRSYF